MSGIHAGALTPDGLDVRRAYDATSDSFAQLREARAASGGKQALDSTRREQPRRRDAQIQERRELRRRRANEQAQLVTRGILPLSQLDEGSLGELAERITQAADADGCDLLRFSTAQASVLYRAWRGSTVLPRTRIRGLRGLIREAPSIEVRSLSATAALPRVVRPAGATSCVHVLIRDQGTGAPETVGILTAYRTTPQSFSAEQVTMLDAIADLLGAELARVDSARSTPMSCGPSASSAASA
jgi:hypothetical protein